jgi:protein TonB
MSVNSFRETIGPQNLTRITLGEILVWGYAVTFVLIATVIGLVVVVKPQAPPEAPIAPPPAIMMELQPAPPPQPDKKAAQGNKPQQKAAAAPTPLPKTVAPEPQKPAQMAPPPATPPAAVPPAAPAAAKAPQATSKSSGGTSASVPVPQAISHALQQRRQQAPAAAASGAQVAGGSELSAALNTTKTPDMSPDQWQADMLAQLSKNKQYPDDARLRGEKGVVFLKFAINPKGEVLTAEIAKSSGFPALDQAALDMIARASPLPPPPAAIARAVAITVPVDFGLQ